MLQAPSAINCPVCLSMLCSKCLLYVDYVFQGKANWNFMSYLLAWCLTKLSLPVMEKRVADEAISVKKGGIYVVFQPPFYQ